MDDIVYDDWGRPEPPDVAGELETLVGFLEFQRATLEFKCAGLDDDQLRRPLPPTSMTLGGMLKHLAFVEDYWFTLNIGRQAPCEPFASADWDADPDWEWNSAAEDTGAELRALWATCVERSRAVLADRLASGPDALGSTFTRWGGDQELSVRWVLVHMVEEYARHNGHADLLRESIDGLTGE